MGLFSLNRFFCEVIGVTFEIFIHVKSYVREPRTFYSKSSKRNFYFLKITHFGSVSMISNLSVFL